MDPERNVMVIAGAGSGKTSVLSRRILFLIRAGIPPENILALTFTEAAATEMQERVASMSKELCLGVIGEPSIGTFHSTCYRLLDEKIRGKKAWNHLGYSTFPSVLVEEELEKLLYRVWREQKLFLTRREMELELEGMHGFGSQSPFQEAWGIQLKLENKISFDSMLPQVLELMEALPEFLGLLRSRYRYILVDEYQDTSPDQYLWLRKMAGQTGSLFLVGDDDQAIYGFRGADRTVIERTLKEVDRMTLVKLETNYRSTPAILEYSNRIFRSKPANLRKVLIPGSRNDSDIFRSNQAVEIIEHVSNHSEALWIKDHVQFLMEQFGLGYGDFAVLFRLNSQRSFYRDLFRQEFGLAMEDGREEVVLSTIHKSKGLQYPVVFLVGLEEGILPHLKGKADRERVEEERRLFYVGVTRAESLLCLSTCRKKVIKGQERSYKISRFLRENLVGWNKWMWWSGKWKA